MDRDREIILKDIIRQKISYENSCTLVNNLFVDVESFLNKTPSTHKISFTRFFGFPTFVDYLKHNLPDFKYEEVVTKDENARFVIQITPKLQANDIANAFVSFVRNLICNSCETEPTEDCEDCELLRNNFIQASLRQEKVARSQFEYDMMRHGRIPDESNSYGLKMASSIVAQKAHHELYCPHYDQCDCGDIWMHWRYITAEAECHYRQDSECDAAKNYEDCDLLLTELFGDYKKREIREWKFVETLGEGDYGIVQRLKNKDGQEFAFKKHTEDFFTKSNLRYEIRMCSSLFEHKNLVKYHEMWVEPTENSKANPFKGDLYLKMELCKETLKNYIDKRNGLIYDDTSDFNTIASKIDVNESLRLIKEIAEGLLYLNRLKPSIFHCDLKSENIFLTEENVIKIGDFGQVRSNEQFGKTEKNSLNFYLAPEYIKNEYTNINHKVDVFALAFIILDLFYPVKGSKPEQWTGFSIPDHKSQLKSYNVLPEVLKLSFREVSELVLKMTKTDINERSHWLDVIETIDDLINTKDVDESKDMSDDLESQVDALAITDQNSTSSNDSDDIREKHYIPSLEVGYLSSLIVDNRSANDDFRTTRFIDKASHIRFCDEFGKYLWIEPSTIPHAKSDEVRITYRYQQTFNAPFARSLLKAIDKVDKETELEMYKTINYLGDTNLEQHNVDVEGLEASDENVEQAMEYEAKSESNEGEDSEDETDIQFDVEDEKNTAIHGMELDVTIPDEEIGDDEDTQNIFEHVKSAVEHAETELRVLLAEATEVKEDNNDKTIDRSDEEDKIKRGLEIWDRIAIKTKRNIDSEGAVIRDGAFLRRFFSALVKYYCECLFIAENDQELADLWNNNTMEVFCRLHCMDLNLVSRGNSVWAAVVNVLRCRYEVKAVTRRLSDYRKVLGNP